MSFLDLLRSPGVEEVLQLGSRFGLLAFHGGLEGGTVEVARAAAEQSGASLYMVVQPPDLRWHVPSHRVGADASPALQRFLDHVEGHDRVWVTRRIDIARHWKEVHPYDERSAFVWDTR